ncbi:MAG: hypothetical protein AAF645_22255 [Myxococcota bacterium]
MERHRFWLDEPKCVVGAFRSHMASADVAAFHGTIRSRASVARVCVGYVHAGTVTSRGALRAIGRLLNDADIELDAWLCCIGGSGFWAATGRSMAAGVMLAVARHARVQLTASWDETVDWLEEHRLPVPSAPTRKAVLDFGAELR